MFKTCLAILALFVLFLPKLLFADDNLAALESVAAASRQAQPGLMNYLVTTEIQSIKENMPGGKVADVPLPAPPVITKFWQRNGKTLIFAQLDQVTTAVEQIFKSVSDILAVELGEMILPVFKARQRQQLMQDADTRLSEVLLAENLIKRLEISFHQPTDLNAAFYASGLRMPQEQVRSMIFDIDTRTRTVSEMRVFTDGGLQLIVEIRYIAVPGGHIPERIQITSPDGKIDDRIEVKFTESDGFTLPASMLRVVRRPELQQDLEVYFKNYRVNQPVPEDIQSRLEGL